MLQQTDVLFSYKRIPQETLSLFYITKCHVSLAIDCGHILEDWELDNGIAFGYDTYCGSAIEFQCLEDYELIGSQSVVCQADGKWSAKKPECRCEYCLLGNCVSSNKFVFFSASSW